MENKIRFFNKNKRLLLVIFVFLACEFFVIIFSHLQNQLIAAEFDNKSFAKKSVEKTIIQAPIQPTETKPISEEIKNNPAKAPIKPKAAIIKSNPISGKTVKNNDGSQTITVSEGPVDASKSPKIAASPPSGNTPSTVSYLDDTGQYPNLGNTLKDYLTTRLKWGGEISSLHGIEVEDAGDTGWAGQYIGSYNLNSNGEVTSVIGWISLNVYYYKNDPNFVDYMKLVLSHEYGHHYSLYYKWTKWKLLAGTRFPDDYYNIRPLAKSTTAADYSLGWANCDAEIMAEDYSYIYSGYGYQAMSAKYGYPSAPTTANWLAGGLVNGPNMAPVSDNPPTVAITSPSSGAELSGSFSFSASASDDIGVEKLAFYVGSDLIGEDGTVPYQTTVNTTRYNNGNYILKVVAYDKSQTSQTTISVTFNNIDTDTENPTITINSPANDPYAWSAGNLTIDASANDNVQVSKMEIYINDSLAASENSSHIIRYWSYSNGPAGTYVLKIKAYDQAGNVTEKSIVINKT